MNDLEMIESVLRKAVCRCRWLRLWRGFWAGLLAGGVVWMVSVGAYKVLPLPRWTVVAGGAVAGAVFLTVALIKGLRRITLSEMARQIDERQRLKERVSTAWELASTAAAQDWKQLVVADAARHVASLEVRAIWPVQWPRISRWALLVVVLAGGLGFVPEYRTEKYRRRQEERANMREVGNKLGEITRRTLAQRAPVLEPTERALEGIIDLAGQLSRASLRRSEALRDLVSMRERLDQQLAQLGEKPGLRSLEKAAREAGGVGPESAEALQQRMESLEKDLGSAAGKAAELGQIKDQLKALREASDLGSGGAGAEARAQMAQNLAGLARQAKDLGLALPGLEEAIAALQADQTDLFLSDLDAALEDLEKTRQMAQALQRLQQQSARAGRNLAEQLEKGQAQLATATLRSMVERLRTGETTSEQLRQMLQEVAEAVGPGQQYGKVGECLANAARRLRQGQKAEAADALAEAADELARMLEQLADAKELQGALAALTRAEMALATGKRWSQLASAICSACNGAGCALCTLKGRGWSQGGKPGAGVGTWADEEAGWADFPTSDEAVDNSGIVRPEMDSRGYTDRGEGELSPNLVPDQLRGKLAPGRSMPSITLKGVSVRGRSSVAFEEVAAAAQAEAQSALNQDRVPRAYRRAVRDYFDDLE